MNKDRLVASLVMHEGMKLKPYYDTVSKLTIGVGRNLTDNGISREEALTLLETDIKLAHLHADTYDWYHTLDDVRQNVVVEMIFNLGATTFRGFKLTQASLARHQFESAADHMLDSKWARQVGVRALRLAKMMRTGKWPDES
jgi:lysozyme